MSPAATIVIPTHDHGATLRASVASAQRQTITDIEIFVIGDGVPDETRDIVAELAREDKRVRFFDHSKGPRHGEIFRHWALNEAHGRIVCYLSDDDLHLPDHVAEMSRLLEECDFAHALAARVSTGGHLSTWTVDLDLPVFRRELLEGRNRVPLSAGAHTLQAYRKLSEGWDTTPAGKPTDLHMWQKFLRSSECRFRSGRMLTVLTFPSPERPRWTAVERMEELQRWLESTATDDGIVALNNRILADKVRESAEAEARALEAVVHGDALPHETYFQVFFPSAGGHNERESVGFTVRIGGWQKLSVSVPCTAPNVAIRIDPSNEPCIVEFAEIVVRTVNGDVLWRMSGENSQQVQVLGTAVPLRWSNNLRLFSDGVDPMVFLPPLGFSVQDGRVMLDVLVRIDVDVRWLRQCSNNRSG